MRKFQARLLVVLFSLASLWSCEDSAKVTDKSAEVLKRAESYFSQGQYSAATIEVKNALKENSSNLNAYLLLARIYLEQGNYPNAVKVLQELPQDNLQVVTLLAETQFYQGKYKSLQKTLDTLATREDAKKSVDFQLLLARSLIQHNEFDRANQILKTLESGISNPATQSTLEVVRSQLYRAQQNPAQQMAALDKALSIQPGNIEALVEKARVKLEASDYESAEDLLSQALIALPTTDNMTLKRLNILHAMVATLTRQGRSVEAMVYSKLIADASPKAQALQSEFESAVEQLSAGNVKKAEEVLSHMYNAENAALAGSLLGLLKFQQGDFRQAAQLLEDTIDPETASPETLRAYAESQLRLQNPAQALKTIEANVREHPSNPDILGIYGLSLLATQQRDKGIETLKAALKLDPSRSRLRLALADAHNQNGQLDKAVEQLEAAYTSKPDDLAVQERLVRQYRIMKKEAPLATLINTLSQSAAPQSQALAGMALLSTDKARASAILDKAYSATPDDAAVLRAQVARHMAGRDFKSVLRFGKELAALNTDDLFALSAIVQAEIAEQRDAAALTYLSDLSKQSANAWGPDFVQARYHLTRGKLDLALQHADIALARSGFNRETSALATRIYLAKAQQQTLNRQFTDARETIMAGLQIAPSSVELMHLLVNIEIEEKKLSAAETLVEEIHKTAPDSPVSLMATADLAMAKGDASTALADYKKAWSLLPTDRLGNILWASIRKDTTDTREKFLAEWKRKLPNSYQALTIEGLYRQETGQHREATDAYTRSLAINSRQSAVHNNLAWLLLESGDPKNALLHAKNAQEMNPENPSILDTFGWVAFKNGDTRTALANLEKAAKLLPDNQEIQTHLAQVRGAK